MRLPALIFGFIMLLLFSCSSWAFDSSSTYNSANMSYQGNSTISQYVVLNNNMQSGGTFVFSVDAHAGGGRPLEHDTGNLRLEFYNASNQLIGSQQTNYTNNLLQMNAWSAAPGDNSEPWINISLTVVDCGGSCTGVMYVKVIMEGTDSSWWAGNYGPQWRVPSLTYNGGNNLLYNPEFGSYNGTLAQGWDASTGWGSCGTTSGSVMCTTTEAGVTANMSGGGYDASGGTTSGTSGGYTSTLTAPTQASAPAPSGPTVDGGTITQTNAPTGQIIISGSSGPTGPTAGQQTRIDIWINSSSSHNNLVYIDQTYGSNNNVTIVQDGYNNRIDFTLDGNGNAVSNTQTGSNYLKIDVPGWGNNVTTTQTNTVGTNYIETKIQGNGNTVNHQQNGNANQMLFNTIQGDINTVTTIQSGAGAHYAESKILGNWNSVKIDQSGNIANKATIDITNAGGPANVDVQQSGGKSFGIIQSCINPAGCTTVIRQ